MEIPIQHGCIIQEAHPTGCALVAQESSPYLISSSTRANTR
jgi:hypothetical protein